MQSVNVLPKFVSQDADLKAKESINDSGKRDGESSFSRLVEQHVNDDKKLTTNKVTDDSRITETATRSNEASKGGNSSEDNSNRQENDTDNSVASAKNAKVDNNATENSPVDTDEKTAKATSDINNKQNEASTEVADNEPAQDSNKKKSVTSNAATPQALTESEQFISLLYNSDQTLKHSANHSAQSLNGTTQSLSNSEQTTQTTIDGDLEQNKSLTLDHKLKSFSNEELATRGVLVNNQEANSVETKTLEKSSGETNTVEKSVPTKVEMTAESKTASNIGVSQSSEQLMKNQLSTADIKNSKLSDVAVGVSQANKTQVTEATSRVLSSDILSEDITAEELALLTRQAAANTQNEVSDKAIAQENLVKDPAIKESIAKGTVGKESDNQSDYKNTTVANSITEGEVKTSSVEKIPTSETPNAQLNNNINSHDKSVTDKVAVTQAGDNVAKEQFLDAKNQQRAQQSARSENTGNDIDVDANSTENLDEEIIESMLAKDKITEQGTKSPTSVTDAFAARATAETQAQTLQASQTKQSNDAYMEHQSSEVLNHTVATDTAQIQKNNVQLQQETISMFRKDFADAVKDKVMIMINQKIQQFDITLDPPEFGNMQVRVNLQGEQAAVNFIVQNQQAKESLEQNMHKLKEMLAEQGVDVGDANVEQQNQKNSDNSAENRSNLASGRQNSSNGLLAEQNQDEQILSTNLFGTVETGVDYYA
ncbi:flagellar hook-length control protein FliK [Colwellia sp. E2M01]|uniref:flagellar hook-length control protein FliK n=1 Tax=Colwellia sp. E2M01 TaxID=2841561 RepID=UPI001C07F62E|nr:flagellar hook-length control protein FliK [Colwellia sp. E2M01]MBU2869949.1 flagellar hook-length control protein FliK [Colwellia sp. E2M01]